MNPEILKKLKNVRPTAAGWQATCPAHDDRKASLSIAVGETGNTVIHCQAGCSVESVISAMGETMKILFNDLPQAPAARKRIAATYDYKDASGKLIFQAVRFEPKSFSQRRPDPDKPGAWLWNLKGVDLVLYRLPELLATPKTDPVFICEGEKDVDSLRALGVTATCNPMGAGKWRAWFNNTLAGREVFIIPDRDSAAKKFAGQKHAADVRDALTGKASRVRVLELPGENVKDASDWIAAGGTMEDLLQLVHACRTAPEWVEPDYSKVTEEPAKDQAPVKKRATQNEADQLMRLAMEKIDLWRTDFGPYATVPTHQARVNMPIGSSSFRGWLTSLSLATFNKAIGDSVSRKIADAIAAQAEFGPVQARKEKLFVRVGSLETADGLNIYIDMCDDHGRCVEITAEGWRIITDPPIKFRRSKSMLPLPEPVPGGSMSELRPLINCHQEDTWILTLSWLIGSLHPKGPYPVLILQGEQGTAKSTMSRILRELIDPNVAPIRCIPKEDEDILIAAYNSWVLCFDNLSGIPDRLSDIFCRLATGGGFSKRELYTNNDEVITEAKRPQILNGIDDVAHRGDLRSRSLILNLDPIPDTARREERLIMAEFEAARPRICGALFSAVSVALKNQVKNGTIQPIAADGIPRLADFSNWVNAAESALGIEFGAFNANYKFSAVQAIDAALESSALAKTIRRLGEEKRYWTGMMSDLLTELNAIADEKDSKSKFWPVDSARLSGRLRRIAPDLRQTGLTVEFKRRKQGVYVKITYTPPTSPVEPEGDPFTGVGGAGVGNSSLLVNKEKEERKETEKAEKEKEERERRSERGIATSAYQTTFPASDAGFKHVTNVFSPAPGSESATPSKKGFLI